MGRSRWVTGAAIATAAGLALTGCTGGDETGTFPKGKNLSTPLTAAPVAGPTKADRVLPGQPLTPTPFVKPAKQPNILMITADDAALGDFRTMPTVRDEIAGKGVTFTNAFAPTPICVPARASLLTGQYSHNHGAVTIDGAGGGFDAFDDKDTLPVWLQAAGYDTFFIGKYLNGYGEGDDEDREYVPPGWTSWNGTNDPTTYNFMAPRVNSDGKVTTYKEYNSRVFSRLSTDLLEEPERAEKPWYMWVNYVAPHHGGPQESDDPDDLSTTVVDPVDRDKFDGKKLPDKPNMFEKDTSDKFFVKGIRKRWSAKGKAALQEMYQQRLESELSIDRAVSEALATLRKTGQLKNTIVVVASDNGYMVGEHNMGGKLWHYRESVQIPMVMRGPGVPKGRKVAMPVGNPDLPTTFAALAGATPLRPQDGINIWPWLDRPDARTRVIPIEAYPVMGGLRPIYRGTVTGKWTYVRFRSGKEELYSRRLDPFQLSNLAYDKRFREQRNELRTLTRQDRDCAGDTCPKDVWG